MARLAQVAMADIHMSMREQAARIVRESGAYVAITDPEEIRAAMEAQAKREALMTPEELARVMDSPCT